MRLSVLTPTLNRRCSFLPRCLESVRRQVGQTFTYEHIVIDDGSTDGTWDYLKELETFDAHIKAVRTETSSKQAHALNCGLRRATGDLILPLDDDDLLLPRSLQMHSDFMEAQPHVDWSFGDAVLVDDQDRLLIAVSPTQVPSGDASLEAPDLFEILIRRNRLVNGAVVIQRRALLDVAGWD